jgi:hypothetical protein
MAPLRSGVEDRKASCLLPSVPLRRTLPVGSRPEKMGIPVETNACILSGAGMPKGEFRPIFPY